MDLHLIDVKNMPAELYQAFGTRDALLTAGDRIACNTMTIGWCQLGRTWGKRVCTVLVRPERYTYQFMEQSRYFTVSVLPADAKAALALCGSKSGRDVDKIKECGLTVRYGAGDAPFFEEAEMVLVCEKLYTQDVVEENLLDPAVITHYYGEVGGLHRIYVGKIVEAYVR